MRIIISVFVPGQSRAYKRWVDRDKIRYYHQIYLDRPDPLVFMPVEVDTSGRVDDDNRVNVQLGMSGPKLSIRVVGDLLGDIP